MGAIVRKKFYDIVRKAPFGGRLTPLNFDGTEAILTHWEKFPYANNNLRCLAYVLATVFHETDGTMDWSIREYSRGKGKSYGKPVGEYGHAYYGRSWPQLTWIYNYQKMTELAKQAGYNVDLVKNPDAILKDRSLAAFVLFEGMYRGISNRGDFTGKAVDDYFKGPRLSSLEAERAQAIGARAVVNGKDKAAKIADYYMLFLDALEASYSAASTPVQVMAAEAHPENAPVVDEGKPLTQSASLWGTITNAIGGVSLAGVVGNAGGFFSAINNPWSLALVLVCIALVVGGGWLVISGRLKIKYEAGV